MFNAYYSLLMPLLFEGTKESIKDLNSSEFYSKIKKVFP